VSLADELAKLHEVQKLDYQIYQREQAIKALNSGERFKLEAIGFMKQHDAAKTVLQKHEAVLRDRELELKGIEQKRAAVHEKLYSGRITNPKELGDLQKDEEMLDEQIGHLEEGVLEVMDLVEGARTTETTLAGQLAAAKRRWKETVAHTEAETKRLQSELVALRPERERLATVVEKSLLRRYDEIRQSREGVGMVVTGTDSCPGCHTRLTPRTMNLLREGEELTLCENCNRILAWGA